MKLVIAIVRPERANDVLEALYRAEVRGLSMTRVQGHGGEIDRVETYRGTTVKMELSEKVRFEIGVSDYFVEPTIEAIVEGARTGEVGDGKIFVLPVERVVRIRTGEVDTAAVTPVDRDRPILERPDRHRRHRVDADGDRARAADDAGARALLRGARALEEHAEHLHDERRRARRGDGHLGARRLLARVRRRRRLHRRPPQRFPAERRASRRARGRRSRTCCSWRTRRRSASSPRR